LLGDIDGLPVGALAGDIDHAFVRTGTITVDLVDCHGEITTCGDLGKGAAVLLENGLSAAFDGIVTTLQDRQTDVMMRN
jgi:hypothetical protein